MILDLADRAGGPARSIINGAVELLSLRADQILIRDEVDTDQVFASASLLPRGEAGRSELCHLRLQCLQVVPAFFLAHLLKHGADEGIARTGFSRIWHDDLALECRVQKIFQRFRCFHALGFEFFLEAFFIVADREHFQIRAIPVTIFVLIFRQDHLGIRRLVRFQESVSRCLGVGIRCAAQPDVCFRCILFSGDTRQRFTGRQTDEADIRARLLLEKVSQFLCRIFMERNIHDQLLAFKVLPFRCFAAACRLSAAAPSRCHHCQTSQYACCKSLPFHVETSPLYTHESRHASFLRFRLYISFTILA